MAHPLERLIGDAPAIGALRDQMRHLAGFDRLGGGPVPTVLLLGETGTGKGLLARVIHDGGARARGPFIDVNCGAIPETMVEAELFGFEAGAFTDARRAKPGLFEAAAGGTLFLDEVDALPLAVQGKLLKAIEDKRVRRLGAVAEQTVDVKLVAATQRDLREMVAARAFRADLFHRLAVVVLEIPPLRTRGDDVLLLAEHFLAAHAVAHGLDPRRLTPGARQWLCRHDWPGNVRALAHLLERVTLLSPDVDVDRDALERLRLPLTPPPSAAIAADTPAREDDDEAVRIRDALRRAGGNVVRAAQLLGLGRNALRGRMRRLGIERPTLDDLAGAAAPRHARAPRRTPAEPAAVVSEPSFEQKPVVVLALDLVLPRRAAEPWTITRRWERSVAEQVTGFGGVFLARTPARMTAVFGVPRALEQLPERAVQAALAIRRQADSAGDGEKAEVRLALHTGAVHVDVRAADPTATLLAVGDTIALAERLLGHAAAGEILASATFARRIEATCELHPRELRVGETEALAAAVVVGQRARSAGATAAAESRFVGREREVALLEEAFDSARDGSGQVALLVGEAGIGKSRLLAELRRRLGSAPHLWIEGHCASYAATTAFHAVADGLRRFAGIDERDDAAGAGAKVEAAVRRFGDDVAWTLPFLRGVLALDPGEPAVAAMDAASRRSETFRALKALTIRLAETVPLVVVAEDLHWVDPASEEYLAFLADAVPATRALLVCTYRPGYRHPFGDRTYHVRVALRALSSGEMAGITASLLGSAEVPAALRALITAKAEGNPFFVEEMTRHLVEIGALKRADGGFVLARDVAEISVPDSIHDVLLARIDHLADEARRAIQVASVIGREFALRLLERIVEAGGAVRTQVEELRSLELIYEKVAHPELAFMFKHALTHDVAYESVLAERRKQLHRTIGLAIEELYADRLAEMYETLAHHFERAEDWERALDYHERAAARAAAGFANRAVIAHCRAALALGEKLGGRVPVARTQGLEEQLGLASFYVSEFRASADAFERAAELARAPEPTAANLARAGLSAFWSHAYVRHARIADAIEAVATRDGVPLARALTLYTRGWSVGIVDGDVVVFERMLAEAAGLLRAEGDEEVVALVGFSQAQIAEWTGDYPRAIALSEQVLALGRRLQLAHLVVWPEWFLGKAYCCLGDYGRAVARLADAYAVCERIGDRAWMSRLLNTLGWCYAEIGSPARAREANERASAVAHAIGDPEIVANSEINLAGNWLALGEPSRAAAHLDPIREGLALPGDPWMRWRYALHAEDAAARLALAARRPDEALAAAERQLEGARRHRVPKVEARALCLRGETLLALERRDDAALALADAVAAADAISYPRAACLALALLAETHRRAGRLTDAGAVEARKAQLVARLAATLTDGGLRAELVAADR